MALSDLGHGPLDKGPQRVVSDEERAFDPRVLAIARAQRIWPLPPQGTRAYAIAVKELQNIQRQVNAQDRLYEDTATRRDIASERNQVSREAIAQREAAAREGSLNRQAQTDVSRMNANTNLIDQLQIEASMPGITPERKALIQQKVDQLLNLGAGGAPTTTGGGGTKKGEYGPEDLKAKGTQPAGAGGGQQTNAPSPTQYVPPTAAFTAPGGREEFTRTGAMSGLYGPGTLGSPYGLEYSGPMTQAGVPASATSGPWTIRALPGPDSPLAPNAYARAFGHTTNQGLSRGVEAAMFADVLRQPIPIGQSGVEALADIGGAGAQQAVQALLRAEPGATIGYPDVAGPAGSGISGASTYLPQAGEVFQPSIRSSKGATAKERFANAQKPEAEQIGKLLAKNKFGYDPSIDPRYAAEMLKNINPELAKQYADYAAGMGFRTTPATPEEQLTGRKEHVFMSPVRGANVPPSEEVVAAPAGQGYRAPVNAFTPTPSGAPTPEPVVPQGSTVTGRGEFRGVYPLAPNVGPRPLDLPTTSPAMSDEARRIAEQERIRQQMELERQKALAGKGRY